MLSDRLVRMIEDHTAELTQALVEDLKILTKYHLRDYIRAAGLGSSAMELYQVQDLHRMLGSFFDKAIYYAVSGYEHAANLRETTGVVHGAP